MSEAQPRGILPDLITDHQVVLLKAARHLRLTCEIRLTAFFAREEGRNLVLSVPAHTTFSRELESYVAQHGIVVQRSEQS